MSKGNYSHNSFRPENNYIGVRLQQGVPLLDSDWNELNDVIRHETYNAVDTLFSDGVVGLDDLAVTKDAAGRLWLNPGAAVLSGRPVRVAARAEIPASLFAASFDGKTPEGIFLDVWEEEVAPDATHPSLNEVTCMRLRRRAWLCVGNPENGPAPDLGHLYLPLARLSRTVEKPLLKDAEIIDLRQRAHLRTARRVATLSVPPMFLPGVERPWKLAKQHFPWQIIADYPNYGVSPNMSDLYSSKNRDEKGNVRESSGIIPVHLPDGVILKEFRAYVDVMVDKSSFEVRFQRTKLTGSINIIAQLWEFTRNYKSIGAQIEDKFSLVDNEKYFYWIMAFSGDVEEDMKIRGFTITYET